MTNFEKVASQRYSKETPYFDAICAGNECDIGCPLFDKCENLDLTAAEIEAWLRSEEALEDMDFKADCTFEELKDYASRHDIELDFVVQEFVKAFHKYAKQYEE